MVIWKAIIKLFPRLFQALVYIFALQWLTDIIGIVRKLIDEMRRRRKLKDDRRGRRPHCDPCSVIIPPDIYKRADPLIYSQYYLMEQGLAVTWDNPDIQLYDKNGNPVSSDLIKPDTDYDVVARIFNNSTDAPAVGLPVSFSFLSFGIGIQSNPIGSVKIDLPIKGAPGHPAFAKIKWHTPSVAGHYCMQVLLTWPDDANPKNNLGQENINVGVAASPAHFTFPVRNDDTIAKRIRMQADAYALPPRYPCGTKPDVPDRPDDKEPRGQVAGTFVPYSEREADWPLARRRHAPSAFPIPAGWSVDITPAEFDLNAGAQRNVKVSITPPDSFRGERPFNINATYAGNLLGGVTLKVQRS